MGPPYFFIIPIGFLFLVLGTLPPYFILIEPQFPHLRVKGIRGVWAYPKQMLPQVTGWQKVGLFIDQYAPLASAQFAKLGIEVSEQQIRDHLLKVRVDVRPGMLASHTRADANLDVPGQQFIGLTHSETWVEIGVQGNLDVRRTALFYELANTVLWKFAGYDVTIAENLISVDDAALARVVKGDVKDLRVKRALLDEAFVSAQSKVPG
jgi:hypothetical protein